MAHGIEVAASGRSKCPACTRGIEKGRWRIPVMYYQEGRFRQSGFVHVSCSHDYFGTHDVIDRLLHYTPNLTDRDVVELRGELEG